MVQYLRRVLREAALSPFLSSLDPTVASVLVLVLVFLPFLFLSPPHSKPHVPQPKSATKKTPMVNYMLRHSKDPRTSRGERLVAARWPCFVSKAPFTMAKIR